MIQRIRQRLMDLAYPSFDCEDCMGVLRECGVCYCSTMNAVAPCTPPSRWIRFLRWILQ